jgi:hypothetical protein
MKIVVAPDKFKGSLPATQVAVVELACVCGLARLPGGRCSSLAAPLTASSFGAGEVLRAALEAGARRIILGVGSTLTQAELATAGITAVYPLSDLEPDSERSRAEAAGLLRRTGQMIARDRFAEAVTKAGSRA